MIHIGFGAGILSVIGFLLYQYFHNIGLRKIKSKVILTTEKLKTTVNSKPEIGQDKYSDWLNYNPEKLWLRILTKTIGNIKKRGELGAKMLVVCDCIERVINQDQAVSYLIKGGSVDFDKIDEMKNQRENIIAIIEQGFSDILKELE
jgi:hypothetical protein